MALLPILQLKLIEALRSDQGNKHAIDNLEYQILHNAKLHERVRQRALERRGLSAVPDYDPDHIPGVLRKHTIKQNGKQREVFSPEDLDYFQSQYFQMGIIGPVADDIVHDDTYAYITGRGIENAISKAIVTVMRTPDCVVKQDDIMDCFNTVPTRVAEPTFPTHTWKYIENVRHRYRELTKATGLPQGHPVAASVINVIINKLLIQIRQTYDGTVTIIVYSDDLTFIGPRVTVMKARAEIQAILAIYGMKLNPGKSRIARPVQGHNITLLGYELEWTSPHSWPLIRPRRKAYNKLEESLADALDLNHAEAIIRGWQNAYRLTNDARHQTRMKLAIDSGMTRWRATPHRTQGPSTGGHR